MPDDTFHSLRPVRTILMIDVLGLAYDPFQHLFTEEDPATDFAEIFVDPHPSLLTKIFHEGHSLIFGHYGTGKTATRFALEFTLRNRQSLRQQPYLSVTYTPDSAAFSGLLVPEIAQQHEAGLAEAWATDLIIQFIERLPEHSGELTLRELGTLELLVHLASPSLRTRLDAAAEDHSGDGAFWRGMSFAQSGHHHLPIRPVVRHVAANGRWRRVVETLRKARYLPLLEDMPPEGPLQLLRQATTALGFRATFLLVDGTDAGSLVPAEIAAMVNPLLQLVVEWNEGDVTSKTWLKCFLPASLDPAGARPPLVPPERLTSHFMPVRINPTENSDLQQILHQRFVAASVRTSSCRSLDELADPELGLGIEAELVRRAKGSPRTLLRLTDALLSFYSDRYAKPIRNLQRPSLTADDWKDFQHQIEREQLDSP